jgi:predicted nucleic acid-binding protein
MEEVSVFLDSNILFALCWKAPEESLFGILVTLHREGRLRLHVSPLVLEEVSANLKAKRPAALPLFARLSAECVVVPDSSALLDLPLPPKDLMLLSTAVAHRIRFFLTGNRADFASLYGHEVNGTTVFTPRAFLTRSP